MMIKQALWGCALALAAAVMPLSAAAGAEKQTNNLSNTACEKCHATGSPEIKVATNWPGRSPEEVVDKITKEQEERLKSVKNLRSMRSISRRASALAVSPSRPRFASRARPASRWRP